MTTGIITSVNIAQCQQKLVYFKVLFVILISILDWETDYGGFTSYIARGEDEEVRLLISCLTSTVNSLHGGETCDLKLEIPGSPPTTRI